MGRGVWSRVLGIRRRILCFGLGFRALGFGFGFRVRVRVRVHGFWLGFRVLGFGLGVLV